jgi:tetratricopeptide (TPR) repeat protein
VLNIFLNLDQQLPYQPNSYVERHTNLAGAWNNWALTQLLSGALPQALPAFREALHHADLAVAPEPLLLALSNLLQHESELREVRRCMRSAEAAVRLADRCGAVQAAIELRTLLAMYATDRNEIWLAQHWLAQARERASALGSALHMSLVDIQLAECLLRQGRIVEGLALSAAVANEGRSAFFNRSAIEVIRLLSTMGIEQPHPFVITLPASALPHHVAAIAAERAKAKASGEVPWKGAHCAISPSAAVDQWELRALWHLGVLEFDGDADGAVETGLRIAEALVSSGYHHEARWAARNQRYRPGLTPAAECRALAILAECAAALGLLDEAREALGVCKSLRRVGVPQSPALCRTGLWFHLQCGDTHAAMDWIAPLVESELARGEGATGLADVAGQLASWGDAAASIAIELARELHSRSVSTTVSSALTSPCRPYRGATRGLRVSHPDIEQALSKARTALQQGDAAAALATLETLTALDDLPESDEGVALALWLHAFSERLDLTAIEKLADASRERLLRSLKFTAVARMEAALMWLLITRYNAPERIAERMGRHGWVAELTDDPIARASLQVWETIRDVLAGRPMMALNARSKAALDTARYFALPEAGLAQIGLNADALARANRAPRNAAPDLIADALAALQHGYEDAIDPVEVDTLLRKQILQLRRARQLTRQLLARMRGERAGWALAQHRLCEAAVLYRRVRRSFTLLNDREGALNAMAGEARALSRTGDHSGAVALFEQALAQAGDSRLRPNLWLGLGAAHLLEGTERSDPIDKALLDRAIKSFDEAIASANPNTRERPLARLARARALGERGEQQHAMDALDLATSELAHQGDPLARTLLEHREQWAEGRWHTLALF